MIKLYNRLPQIYYDNSRDFQAFARAHEVVLNYLKTNVDVAEALPFSNNFDISLLNLMALTLGFTSKHNYNTEDLFNLCSAFAEILKDKGSIESVRKTIRILLNAQSIKDTFSVDRDSKDRYNLLIYLPVSMKDLVLLEDVFDYILPSGFTYSFISTDFLSNLEGVKLKTQDTANSTSTMLKQSQDIGQVSAYGENTQRFTADTTPTDISQVSTGVVVGPDETSNT